MLRASPPIAGALLLCWLPAGCAGYEGAVRDMRTALDAGDRERALEATSAMLGVDTPDDYPLELEGEVPLMLLERATIQQALGRHAAAARDFQVADRSLEVLDVENDTAGSIGKYLFSDDVTTYKAPPYEKLLLSSLAMLDWLAAGKLEDARVEARRLNITRGYLRDTDSPQAATLGLGSYLAGFTYEMSGRADEALRHYDDALASHRYATLVEPVRRLAACTTYRSERLSSLLAPAAAPDPAPICEPRSTTSGTLLVVAMSGRAPYKRAMRIPIGAALVIAGSVMYGPGLGLADQRKANELAAKGLLTWINFPVLERHRGRFLTANVKVDGATLPAELGLDVAAKVESAWDAIKGSLMVAAITRMITRAVAGEVAQQAAKGGGAAGGLALLAGLAVQGAMVAADTPDTRSWTTLPGRVELARGELPPGRHRIVIEYLGPGGRQSSSHDIDVPAGGFAVLPVATLR